MTFTPHPTHVGRLRIAHPGNDEAWYHERASRYISPPAVAPHVAGAAVDLTLCDGDGLWLGTEVNDTDTEDCHTDSVAISPEAKGHRHTLSEALTAVGLVNYPTEWWHWSYGDRYWAYTTRASAARYGPTAWLAPDRAYGRRPPWGPSRGRSCVVARQVCCYRTTVLSGKSMPCRQAERSP
ncbi:M15 family metallopeptidase [Sphaerisporangium perillae]|uniref:M15 family metallopeptidase n=1 Tax=Sphaerisporangium perillae TaxID=2935860 RepID=UPI00200F88D5|nr:M15 family metallopeptidase [Sphaerisporangium perillae]